MKGTGETETPDALEQASFIGHCPDLSKCQCSFENARPTLRMPSFYMSVELLACVKYTIIVVLIVYWSRQAVPEHPLRERR